MSSAAEKVTDINMDLILREMERTNKSVHELAGDMKELTKVMIRKESEDKQLAIRADKSEEKVEKLEQRVKDLEDVAAADAAIAVYKNWFVKGLIGAAAGGTAIGIVWVIVNIAAAKGGA